MACEIVAAIKKCDHIFLIKRFIAGFAKIGWNARKVEINSVAPRDGIDTVQISDPLVLDQRRDRTLRNRDHILTDGLPFGIDLSVSDNVQARLRGGSSRLWIVGGKRKYRRSDKDLSGDATVDMQFVVALPANPHLDPDWREYPGKRRRCEQYFAKEAQRIAIPAQGNPTHVP